MNKIASRSSSIIVTLVVAGVLGATWTEPVRAQERGIATRGGVEQKAIPRRAPINNCDRLAASPEDLDRVADGTEFETINVEHAVPACETAVRDSPRELRFQFQLGRSLLRAGRNDGVQYMRSASNLGYTAAQASFGAMLVFGSYNVPNDVQLGIGLIKMAAQVGNPYAQHVLGALLHQGTLIGQNDTEAARWFELAARQGYAPAEDALATLVVAGRGLPRDYARAVELFRSAADKNNAHAMSHLAAMYVNGLGVERDLGVARDWYRKAVAHGNASASEGLKRVEEQISAAPDVASPVRSTESESGLDRSRNPVSVVELVGHERAFLLLLVVAIVGVIAIFVHTTMRKVRHPPSPLVAEALQIAGATGRLALPATHQPLLLAPSANSAMPIVPSSVPQTTVQKIDFDQNDVVLRHRLEALIGEYGTRIVSQPGLLKGLLMDACPEHDREINWLVGPLQAGLLSELLRASGEPSAQSIIRTTARLQRDAGLQSEIADWIVRTWADAMRHVETV